MEVSSNNQSSNDSKPQQMECHVASANSCNNNETPTVRGLATDNNNMQSVLMGNMETIMILQT